jgi:hypothetical protein
MLEWMTGGKIDGTFQSIAPSARSPGEEFRPTLHRPKQAILIRRIANEKDTT